MKMMKSVSYFSFPLIDFLLLLDLDGRMLLLLLLLRSERLKLTRGASAFFIILVLLEEAPSGGAGDGMFNGAGRLSRAG